MTKAKLLSKMDHYPNEPEDIKRMLQLLVLDIYAGRNRGDDDDTFLEIMMDIKRFEEEEKYERCLLLKDILIRFERIPK